MKLKLFVCAIVLVIASTLFAQESITLTTPVTKTATTYSVTYVGLDVVNGRVSVQLATNTGDMVIKTYDASTNPTGATLLHNLNTANFSVNSLLKAVYNRLLTDGVIPAGSVVGSPQ